MLDRAEVVTVACAGPDDCVDPLSEFFGSALAAGDVDGDGYADLAVGVPGESFGPCCPAPATGAHGDRSARRRGHPPAPRWAERDICGGQRVLEPGLAGVQDQAESHAGSTGGACCGDGFGSALAIGDFNDDGRGDLAIGVPREHVPGAPCWEDPCWHGAVNVLYGTGSGLTAAEDDYWPAQDFLPGARWAYADLGSALSAGDVNGDGVDDLAVGAPGHDVSQSASGAGAVEVLPGVPGSGLTRARRQLWTQSSAGVGGASQRGDRFGSHVHIAQFSGSAIRDLVVSVPGEDVGDSQGAGRVVVLRGATGGLTATGHQSFDQDTSGVKGAAEARDHFGAQR